MKRNSKLKKLLVSLGTVKENIPAIVMITGRVVLDKGIVILLLSRRHEEGITPVCRVKKNPSLHDYS